MPPAGSGLWPARGPLGRARDRRLYRITSRQWRQGQEADDAERARLGLPPAAGRWRASSRRCPRSRSGVPTGRPTPTWSGPLEWDPADTDLRLPPGDGPLVMLSATTVSGAVSGLAAATLDGLEGTGARVAWTLLAPPDDALPAWVSRRPGRQAPLIEAADLVVCGGGHGILAKALGRGRPVVTVPGGGEQRENADRVRRAGLGVRVPAGRLTPARLRAAVERLLTDPGYRRRAEACRPADGARPAGDRAVDVLERVAEGRLGHEADVTATDHADDPPAATVAADLRP